MRADQTILFTDLDGTLFASDGSVSPGNRAAIEEYIAAGGRFALSTGRAPRNALRFLGDLPTNAPSVVFNGAGVYEFATGKFGFLRHIDKTNLFPLLRWALEHIPGVDIQLYTADEILYATPLETAQPEYLAMHQPARFAPLDTLTDAAIVKSLLLPPQDRLDFLGEKLEAAAPGAFDLKKGTIPLGGGWIGYYELMPPEATKGAALRSLRSHPAVSGRTVLAAGDYWNDYELLQEADVPVAPANAIDEIKNLCRFVTASNDDDAIAHIIRDIIPALP